VNPTLTLLDGPLLEAVHDETYPIWGQGLTRDAYGRWNRAQAETPWGRARFRRVGFVRDGAVLASAKTYGLTARIGGTPVDILGIGAVFTSPAHRGRGHAHALLDAWRDAARRGRRRFFSEIGPDFYARGFIVMPREITTLAISSRAGAPMALVRTGESSDPRPSRTSPRACARRGVRARSSADFSRSCSRGGCSRDSVRRVCDRSSLRDRGGVPRRRTSCCCTRRRRELRLRRSRSVGRAHRRDAGYLPRAIHRGVLSSVGCRQIFIRRELEIVGRSPST
jgi:GNAT superfamily N-acetyltransferase